MGRRQQSDKENKKIPRPEYCIEVKKTMSSHRVKEKKGSCGNGQSLIGGHVRGEALGQKMLCFA